MATLTAYPSAVAEDATSLLVFQGPPLSTVSWSLAGGGVITNADPCTDALGMAKAVFTSGIAGDTPTIQVTYGA